MANRLVAEGAIVPVYCDAELGRSTGAALAAIACRRLFVISGDPAVPGGRTR